MKHLFTVMLLMLLVLLVAAPSTSLAAGDTLVVYAKGATLDKVIRGDTLANGSKAHHVYQLVSLDTTYIFDGTITTNSNFAVIGVPSPTTGRPPCIQPDVLGDGSIPGVLFTLTGNKTTATFKNLYLLGIAINNAPNYASGQAIQISGDSIRTVADNVIFEQWSQFAIGYSGNWDKFFITNCKFRNMTTQPNQWYVGEVLRNENYLGKFPTDTVLMRSNTMLCVSGYASCPVTVALVSYFDFSHNSVVYTFKNPFFIFNLTNGKVSNNVFYGAWAGAISKTEYPWWDQLWSPEIGSIIDFDALDSAKVVAWKPNLPRLPSTVVDTAAEKLRTIEVKNNAYFWPKTLTDYWKAWNDTAHVDSIYLPTWMNARTTNMFTDKKTWPGFVQTGNQNADPGYGATISGVLTQSTNGLLNWFKAVRTGTGTTNLYGYQITQVGTALNWVPPWPLPEAADMKYTNATLKTGGTDGLPVGDPGWFGIVTGVQQQSTSIPAQFTLSAAYPNPFNPSTNFEYALNTSGMTSLKVYNLLGQLVKVAVNNMFQSAGSYRVNIDMSTLPSGMYVAILEQGNNRVAQKMMLMK
ncbi:MAG TPA: T9SS type A sorting domain-containing protein [Bacteroidota bacterium]|nr:T9SS type A sorting domain-containing protein [Bacteroidota bacterium]